MWMLNLLTTAQPSHQTRPGSFIASGSVLVVLSGRGTNLHLVLLKTVSKSVRAKILYHYIYCFMNQYEAEELSVIATTAVNAGII